MAARADVEHRRPPSGGFDLATAKWTVVAALVLGHVALGLAAEASGAVAAAHALGTIVVVGWLAATTERADVFAGAAAYVTGSEVFWRMNGAPVPWEGAKYLCIAIFSAGIIRLIGGRVRRIGLSLAYVAVLLPSSLVTLERFGPNGFESISFNVMAHVALAVGVVFFTNVRTDRQTLASVLWFLVLPILAVAAIATSSTVALEAADFGTGSNAGATGGYGPNQVSALLGLALLACIFLMLLERRAHLQAVAGILAVWMLGQGALTFSRGGLFNVAVALLAAAPFVLRTARNTLRVFGTSVVVLLAVMLIVMPVVSGITGGAIEQRFASRSTTLRTDLASEELSEFADNPGFGTGVGLSERNDPLDEIRVVSHTEFSRLLAEHGILGLVAIALMVVMAIRGIRDQELMVGRAFSAACAAWVIAEMSHSATRLAAVAFVFALGQLVIRSSAAVSETGDPQLRSSNRQASRTA